jgi:toxin FitB
LILLDTNVLSELTRPSPAPTVVTWLEDHEPLLTLPTVALAELGYGIARLSQGRRKASLLEFWLTIRDRFAGRTFAFDVRASEAYGELVATAERRGRTVHVAAGQIAAIASVQNMTVATRDVDDFEPTGVRLINPWTSA